MADRPRRVAFELLRAVADRGAYANLLLPQLMVERGLAGRDAALATELGYGTLRAQGTLDAVLASLSSRGLATMDPPVLDLLRLGAYQLLRTRIPPHAAVATTVELARATGNGRSSGFVNAVLRKVSARDWDSWVTQLATGEDNVARLSLATAHPRWIVEAFADALGEGELEAALRADDARPQTHLVAWPSRISVDELAREAGGEPGPYSPFAVRLADGGDPGRLAAITAHRAAVQDEGSQLCALALTRAPLSGRDEHWLDLCAGPGGKAALLAALAQQRGARLVANELHPHRSRLVAQATEGWDVPIHTGDARLTTGPAQFGVPEDGFDRILLDAPCSGLGALRRRPEARWRRTPEDIPPLALLQVELMAQALRLLRPGGVLAYVTCSPHRAETTGVLAALEGEFSALDTPALLDVPDCAAPDGAAQLWPHRHDTDAMFCALLTRLR